MTVLLDTVGLLAVWDHSDQWHGAANACFARLQAAREELLSTTFILCECGNAAARRPYRDAIWRLREKLETSKLSSFQPKTTGVRLGSHIRQAKLMLPGLWIISPLS